jgi:hypothetical protein
VLLFLTFESVYAAVGGAPVKVANLLNRAMFVVTDEMDVKLPMARQTL